MHTSISIHTSTSESTPPPEEQSSPITPPDVVSLAGLPLTILPEPARMEIAIPPRALSHLHSSSDTPDPVRKLQATEQYAIRQGVCYEGAAIGAHGLLATSPAAEPTTPASDSGACANTTNSAPATATDPDDLQDANLDLDLDLDISMDPEPGPADTDADADTHGIDDDDAPPHPPPLLLLTAGTHDHPDGPMLGFVIPEHDGADHGPSASVDVGSAFTSPSQGLNFDLTFPNRGAEGWIDWRDGNVFGGAGASTDTGVGEYAGDGTIDPSVLGGGGDLSPGKPRDEASSPVCGFDGVQPSRMTDEDDEEEKDVMGMLFENTSDDNFVPASGLGKGKGRAVIADGVVESAESVAAAAGSRMRRKSWRKELADKVELGTTTTATTKAPVTIVRADTQYLCLFLLMLVARNAPRHRRHQACFRGGLRSATFAGARHPGPRCTLIKASADEQCRALFCELCIEKRYPQMTFDRTAGDFECPVCRTYCICLLCSRKCGEAYVPERDGGWCSWVARQGGSHRTVTTPASKSKSWEPVSVPPPPPLAKQHSAKTTTTTDAQVFDGSWSVTVVFTVSGEPLGTAPRLSPPARYPNPRRNCNSASICLSGNRAGGGGGWCSSQVPTTTSWSRKRRRGRGNRRSSRAADAGVSGSGSLWEA
ncbi:hypothetical protein H4582DRAFT_364171 [Lactarius indigo]|nr:hypothetical protein H4582DRAFT_364171 [Lactarius indigo]